MLGYACGSGVVGLDNETLHCRADRGRFHPEFRTELGLSAIKPCELTRAPVIGQVIDHVLEY
jgi:hypothetical protein